jgi:hypothetical protein
MGITDKFYMLIKSLRKKEKKIKDTGRRMGVKVKKKGSLQLRR